MALVGGGGKTSTMFQLASELVRASPKKTRVLTTTSTRIFAAQIRQAPAYVTFDPEQQTIANVLTQLDTAVNQHGQVLLIGRADRESGKAFGIPPDIVDELAGTNRFDIIINEADGSRMRPLKAPAEHEPVIPTSTTVVVPVAGIDALGRPLNDETVHRAALVSRLSGTPLGQRLTVDTIATVLSHPQGGLALAQELVERKKGLRWLEFSNVWVIAYRKAISAVRQARLSERSLSSPLSLPCCSLPLL